MSKWVYRLDLKDLWKARNEATLTVEELAREVAKRIRKLRCYKKYEEELEEIATQFEYCSESVEEFDGILSELYDWADTCLFTPIGQMQRKMCWIATF